MATAGVKVVYYSVRFSWLKMMVCDAALSQCRCLQRRTLTVRWRLRSTLLCWRTGYASHCLPSLVISPNCITRRAKRSEVAYCLVNLESGVRLKAFSFDLSTFYPRDAMRRAGYSDRNVSVCPSVCPSVTRRYCVRTKKASGMISSPSPKTLVFWRQISPTNSKGFHPNGGLKQGSIGKIQRFFSFKRQYLENGSRYGQSYY